ncbi:SE1832 family protein [Bacillus sp. PS06]|uniref:SE1832 family protein n=1 Tax=Bacillus sp. PS06 TaxID=2764176 RepID=UPI001781B627|nr:SE1832 family protein [Bacillus sp. PS06]MBD8067916.1 hypothetical protein [Bacillus sp. PS06]
MKSIEIENKLTELKMEYIRTQGDIERLESLGHPIDKQEQKLQELEREIKYQRSLL